MAHTREHPEEFSLPTDLMGRLRCIPYAIMVAVTMVLLSLAWGELRNEPGWQSRVWKVFLLESIAILVPNGILAACWAIATPQWVLRCHAWLHFHRLPIATVLVVLGLAIA